MEQGHQVKKVSQNISIGFMLPEARDIMDEALEEWEKFKEETRGHYPDFATENEVYSFAYWLFRWSGLIQYNIKEESESEGQ